jgi:hypothetical protein
MTSSTPAKRPKTGSMIMELRLWYGLHNHLTSIPLNIFGITSKESLQGILMLLLAFKNCRKG